MCTVVHDNPEYSRSPGRSRDDSHRRPGIPQQKRRLQNSKGLSVLAYNKEMQLSHSILSVVKADIFRLYTLKLYTSRVNIREKYS